MAFQIIKDDEKKVIRLGCYFYTLKGVLINEATDEEKEKYCCGKFMTYPIVGDDYEVAEDDCITDGIEMLLIGKQGYTIPLRAVKEAADYNARENCCEYSDVLRSLERQGITVSNRKAYNSNELLPDEITLCIDDKLFMKDTYRLDCNEPCYYVPRRFFTISKEDGKLYQLNKKNKMDNIDLVERLVEDIWSLIWFFNRKQIRVKIRTYREDGYGYGLVPNELQDIPDDWPEVLLGLEAEINARLDKLCAEYKDDYCRNKREDKPKVISDDTTSDGKDKGEVV